MTQIRLIIPPLFYCFFFLLYRKLNKKQQLLIKVFTFHVSTFHEPPPNIYTSSKKIVCACAPPFMYGQMCETYGMEKISLRSGISVIRPKGKLAPVTNYSFIARMDPCRLT